MAAVDFRHGRDGRPHDRQGHDDGRAVHCGVSGPAEAVRPDFGDERLEDSNAIKSAASTFDRCSTAA